MDIWARRCQRRHLFASFKNNEERTTLLKATPLVGKFPTGTYLWYKCCAVVATEQSSREKSIALPDKNNSERQIDSGLKQDSKKCLKPPNLLMVPFLLIFCDRGKTILFLLLLCVFWKDIYCQTSLHDR